MSSCCGGNADALLAAKAAIAGMMASPVEPGKVRLEYIGENVGAISFFGQNGVEYRGGNNDIEKYVDAHEVDVPRLVSTGKWRMALAVVQSKPVETRTPEPVKVVETKTPEPELAAVTVPDVIEVTAEDRKINEMIEKQRKEQKQPPKKGKR